MSETEMEVVIPNEPAPAPRAVTSRVRRHAWFEASVRQWWLAAMLLLLAVGYFAYQQYREASQEAWLREKGTRIEAIVWRVEDHVPGRPLRPTDLMRLEVNDPEQLQKLTDPKPFTLQATAPGAKGVLTTGEPLTILVDPASPTSVWTSRLEPVPLLPRLTIAFMILPFALVVSVVAIWMHRRIINVWINGQAHEAVVMDTRQTATAPMSWLVHCAYRSLPERRLMKIFLPHSVGRPANGQIIWVIAPEANPLQAIAAASYEKR